MDIKRLEKMYDAYEFEDQRVGIVVKKDSKVGLIDREFNVIIPLMYESLYLVDFDTKRMIVQKDRIWMVINKQNNILFKSKHNYDENPEWPLHFYDSSYFYVPALDGYIEHYKDKIIFKSKNVSQEFALVSDSAMCFDDTPLIYFFDGEVKGYLNLETGFIQLDILMDVRKKKFKFLKAYDVDAILCAGTQPYSLFYQDEIIEELKDNGVTTIINLMQNKEMKYNTIAIEKEFKVLNFPIVENSVPSIDILYEIMHAINHSEKTYIHCDLGLGRTGVIVAYYLHKKYAYTGISIFQKMEKLRLDFIFNDKKLADTQEQREFILQCI